MVWFKRKQKVEPRDAPDESTGRFPPRSAYSPPNVAPRLVVVRALVNEEQEITRKEISAIERAIQIFYEIQRRCYFTNDEAVRGKFIAVNTTKQPGQEKPSLAIILECLEAMQQELLSILTNSAKIIKLGNRIEADLLDIRNGDDAAPLQILSNDESAAIAFAKDIQNQITTVLGNIKAITKTRLLQAKNQGYCHPEDMTVGKELRTELITISLLLEGLKKKITDLFTLEKAVEKLTEEYAKG